MAYAAVASVSETIDIVLKYHKESISPEFEDQIKSIQKHSFFFRSFLEEFRERANNWDETIREVTDRAEEIIELLLLETTVGSGSSTSKCEVDYSLGDLEGVSEEMESTTNKIKGKHTEAIGGVDEELMEIISRLRDCDGSSSREVIAIVGMGGMGKAALAKKAYDHPLIVEHFEIRACSTISQVYSRKGITVELLRCMKAEPQSISESEDEMMVRVYKNLQFKRYLIVLNDLWSIEDWGLKHYFPDNGNGSRIIITTRLSNLCKAAEASYIHEIRLLNEDKAWNLVRQNVFRGDPCPSQLESVGKMIARSCRGHPLSIQVVSGILAAVDHTLAAWEDILENINNANQDADMGAFGVLSLSYAYLPHHLRPCFLYLGCFPEDEEIRVSKLIKLWVAEGFLNETDCKSCEDIGEEHVENLVRRGLVSVTKWKSNGTRIKSITIHDVMRDLCLSRARIDNFNYHLHGWSVVDSVNLLSWRRLTTSITYGDDNNDDILEDVHGSTIRTIILSSDVPRFDSTIRWSITNLRLLRILDLLNAYNDDLDDQVFHLFHLRYLAFRCRFRIPKAISDLQNLQTLIIRPTVNDGQMFDDSLEDIWRMPQLRHLFISYFNLPTHQILGPNIAMSALEDLQTLSRVLNFICSRGNLKMIPNLRKMALLYTTDDVQDYELHNLICLHRLQILKIEFYEQQHNMSCALQFPPTLKKLNLCGIGLPWEDMTKIVASLPNLEVLKLRWNACIGQTWETSEGGFSKLIYLLIGYSHLENWKTETGHFPKLKHLVLLQSWNLLEVPNEIGKIPTLELIELDDDNRSLLSSAYQIRKDRQRSGDDRLQIRVV